MTTAPRPRLLVALAAAGAAASMLLSGCAVFSEVQTDRDYQASEGVNKDVGVVHVRALALIGAAADKPGVLSGQLVNASADKVTVTFAVQGGGSASQEVPANGSVSLNSDNLVTVDKVGANPGDMIMVQVGTSQGPKEIVEVPVLPAVGHFEKMVPAS